GRRRRAARDRRMAAGGRGVGPSPARAQEAAGGVRRHPPAGGGAPSPRREKMATDKIAQVEAQAVADVRNHAVDIAMAAAAKLLKEGIDAGKGDELIDSAIRELDRKLH